MCRMVGFCFDVSDGCVAKKMEKDGIPFEKMDKDAQVRHLKELPGLFEVCMYSNGRMFMFCDAG